MEADLSIYVKLSEIDWFARCGANDADAFQFPVETVSSAANALESARSDRWFDVRTEAKGDLTAYLGTHHPSSYAGHWNRLAESARDRLRADIIPRVETSLERLGAGQLSTLVMFDLTNIAQFCTYRRRYKRVPNFYGRLLTVYQAGHLPCGWSEPLAAWPSGHLVIY